MQNPWNNEDARNYLNDPLSARAYATSLIAKTEALANGLSSIGSAKTDAQNPFGENEAQLVIIENDHAGENIETSDLLAFKQESLLKINAAASLSADDCETQLQLAATSPLAQPAPLAALLHAAIPARFVDQTCAAPILALVRQANCTQLAEEIYAQRVLVIPAASSLSEQARSLATLIQSNNLESIEGVIVAGIGLLAFHDEAEQSYKRSLQLTEQAQNFFEAQSGSSDSPSSADSASLIEFAELRQVVSTKLAQAQVGHLDDSPAAINLSNNEHANTLLGTSSAITKGDHQANLESATDLQQVAWPNRGIFSFGINKTETATRAVRASRASQANQLAGADATWSPVHSEASNVSTRLTLQGKIALVSGSAAGIGLATATTLAEAGACVIGADINPEITDIMTGIGALGITINLTDEPKVKAMIEQIISTYGGLDIVVSNAGIFTAGAYLEDMEQNNWDRSFLVNLTSHQILLKHAIPFVKKGIDPAIILMGSRNVNAPGAGAASYSCAKAGLTQLCRVAALELAPDGVRVNIIHPDAVFDTKLWTKEALERSAERYGITVEQYKKRNLMKTEITSRSVGNVVVALASTVFGKTTGAQIPVDGGNDRII
ncbi:MAG: NAD(P)-dependent dehydrogenase (short-subunit alcohol dehydrogenase family) [Candidatus Pelagisphaera sp.]|jgi:NAD(P)-dependent dehydrogenase (short-subunit alcohol dehydrogenase family)/rhamnose utilization protein RhaD (predicted bifunctional aldolase and dehydrogenase)